MRKVLFLSLLLIAVSGMASATSVQFQGGFGSTSSLTTSGGSNIALNMITITNGGNHTYFLSSAFLNFTLTSLTITGDSSMLGISGEPVLFQATGLNSSDYTVTGCGTNDSSCVWTFAGAVPISIGSALVTADPVLAGMNWSFTGGTSSGNSSSPFQANSTHFTMTGTVPEPASMLLIGSGLAALGTFRRRKFLH